MFEPDRRHLFAYLAAAAVLVVIAVRLLGHQGGLASAPSVSMAAPPPPSPGGGGARPRAVAPSIWVDVAGEVRRPGLYRLPAGSRVAAALAKAGGPRRLALTMAVNLAAKLNDGQQIIVPARGTAAAATGGSATATAGAAPTPGSPVLPGAKVALSTASQAQLEQLDGIGPGLAGRIIQYRQAHGGFRSVDQLQEVSGIGAKRFQALRDGVQP
jgi:competence protein ComEA